MRIKHFLPILLLSLGLWLLAGCFYLPVPERAATDKEKDFRKLIGSANSKRPLRTGQATRDQVVALLGDPPYASKDQRSIAYVFTTVRGVWVFPLCFTATEGKERIYALRLDFDEHEILAGSQVDHQDYDINWFNGAFGPPEELIRRIQHADHPLVGIHLPKTRLASEPAVNE